jgi:hypothetical protein
VVKAWYQEVPGWVWVVGVIVLLVILGSRD